MSKLEQLDLDLSEVDAALERASRGLRVNYKTAGEAFQRIAAVCGKKYKPMVLVSAEYDEQRMRMGG